MSSRETPTSTVLRHSAGRDFRELTTRIGRTRVSFHLYRRGTTLTLEWQEYVEGGPDRMAVLHFQDPASFRAWWEDDVLRFAHPHLHRELQRDALELWELGDG